MFQMNRSFYFQLAVEQFWGPLPTDLHLQVKCKRNFWISAFFWNSSNWAPPVQRLPFLKVIWAKALSVIIVIAEFTVEYSCDSWVLMLEYKMKIIYFSIRLFAFRIWFIYQKGERQKTFRASMWAVFRYMKEREKHLKNIKFYRTYLLLW